jgi:aminopeptidase N
MENWPENRCSGDWPDDWPDELPDELPDDLIESSLANFNHRNHSALTIGFLRPALAALPQLKRERKIFFVLAWLNSFIGGHPPARALPIVDQFLAEERLEPDLAAKIRQIADRYRNPD